MNQVKVIGMIIVVMAFNIQETWLGHKSLLEAGFELYAAQTKPR